METIELDRHFRLVQSRVEQACKRVGRSPDDVKIVAVGKMKPASILASLYELGHRSFGENYADELRHKSEELDRICPEIKWHMVGPLQRNKVKWVVGKSVLIHSVDRVSLLDAISKEVSKQGLVRQDCLVQVNLGREPQKSGCVPEALPALLDAFGSHGGKVRCVGLMCIPPYVGDAERTRLYFQQLKALQVEHGKRAFPFVHCKELSMGMSEDFEVAVEEGATLIRLGRVLFGAR